jgi:hypothetical protein
VGTSVLVPNRVKRMAHSLSNHRSKRGLRARVRTALRVGGGGLRGLRRVVLTVCRGKGVPKDEVEAVRWYRLAANQGYAYAQ